MSKNESPDSSDKLTLIKEIEIVESRRRQLLERKDLCKDKSELREIEKQLKQIDVLLRKLRSIDAKI